VLINGIHLQCNWKHKFEDSPKRPFFIDSSKRVSALFMTQKQYYNFAELPDLDANILEIDYKVKYLLPVKRLVALKLNVLYCRKINSVSLSCCPTKKMG
jgi:serine protease inhibitor